LIVFLLLIALIVLALNPGARQKAADMVQNLQHNLDNTTVVVTTPTPIGSNRISTPAPTVTPRPTATPTGEIIPNTGSDEDKTEEPIIQVNWDALGAALRKFWDSLRNIKIDLNPQDNK
jgi:hypothetical protein